MTIQKIALVLMIGVLAPSSARAETENMERYNRACKGLSAEEISRKEYCHVAKGARKAKIAASVVLPVQITMTAICTLACTNTPWTQSLKPVCSYGGIAVGALDLALAAGLRASAAEMTAAAGSLAASTISTVVTATSSSADSSASQVTACLSAVTSAMRTVTLGTTIKSSKETWNNSLTEAEKHLSEVLPMPPAPPPEAAGGSETAIAGAAPSQVVGGSSGEDDAQREIVDQFGPACGAGGSTMSCALAADTTLPRALGSPDFAKTFEKATGQNLDSFMKSAAQNPSGAMASIAGGVPAGPVQNAVKKAFADAERLAAEHPYRFNPEGAGVRYAGSRGAVSSGGTDPFAANMSKMMGQFMNQLGGGTDAKQKDPLAGLKTIAFVARTKGADAVAEDRKINLFDRISYRYYSLSYQGLGNSAPAGVPAQNSARTPASR